MSHDDGEDCPHEHHIHLDGATMTINMLMGALRRQACLSLGFDMDGSELSEAEGEEVRKLMTKLTAQGLADVIEHGMMGLAGIQDFVSEVADELSRQKNPRVGLVMLRGGKN